MATLIDNTGAPFALTEFELRKVRALRRARRQPSRWLRREVRRLRGLKHLDDDQLARFCAARQVLHDRVNRNAGRLVVALRW